MRAWLAALLAGLALGAAPAAAELIEYRLPDGRTGYTNEPARVPPGAEILSSRETSPPSGEPAPVEPLDAGAAPSLEPPAAEAAAAPASDAEYTATQDALEEGRWRQRVREAQRAVREARIRVQASERVYSDCRGRENHWNWRHGPRGDWRYHNSGFDSSCESEAGQLEVAQEELAEADTYLADGLFEDCRRSGCLPGWIR